MVLEGRIDDCPCTLYGVRASEKRSIANLCIAQEPFIRRLSSRLVLTQEESQLALSLHWSCNHAADGLQALYRIAQNLSFEGGRLA